MIRFLRALIRKIPGHLAAGVWGEQQAERYLKGRGYALVGRRVRVGRRDELDLIMRKGEVLVFVEVKTRKGEAYGRPFSAVNRAKRTFISRAVVRYLMGMKATRRPPYFRIDVVEVIGQPGPDQPEIRHIENAFTLDKRYRLPW